MLCPILCELINIFNKTSGFSVNIIKITDKNITVFYYLFAYNYVLRTECLSEIITYFFLRRRLWSSPIFTSLL